MPQKIVTNLWFDTEAEEAANFYVSVFKSSRILTVRHYPEDAPRPAGMVMVVEFELWEKLTDGGEEGPCGWLVVVDLLLVLAADLERDGLVELELRTAVDRDEALKDRFGLSWQVTPEGMDGLFSDPDPERSRRAMKAMLSMRKLDIAELERAADGVPTG